MMEVYPHMAESGFKHFIVVKEQPGYFFDILPYILFGKDVLFDSDAGVFHQISS